jgi:hypothetical protein
MLYTNFIPSFLTDTGYSVGVIGIDLVGCAVVTGTPCNPSIIAVKNYGIGPP